MIKETGVGIRDILDMKALEKCKVIAGEDGLDRIITRVNVMADPDILSWVDEGEFLLTTGYFFKTAKLETQMNIIRECNYKRLSGIGIKIFPYLEKLSDEIIELANKLNFPIIELDYEVPFTDIMTPVFQEIFDRQSSIIRKVETVHKDTMNVVLKGGGIKDILNSLSKTIENPVLVKDHHFDEYTLDSSCDQKIYSQLEENLTTYFKGNTNVVRHSKTIFDKTIINDEEVDRIMVPIMVKNNIYGHLVSYGVRRELTNFDALYMESTSNVIALEFLKRISVQEVENKYKAEFFEDLISLDQKRKEKAIDRANYYRFDKDASYNIISIRLSKTESKISTDEEYNQIVTKAMYVVDMICKNEGRTYLLANKGKKINILFMWKDQEDCKKNTSRIAEIINETLRNKIDTLGFKVGIGRMYDGIEDVHRSLQDAENAVEASKTYIDTEIIDFDALGIYKIFCQDNLKDELLSFYQSTLEPLVIYDRKRDTELVKSLMVYFETNGNLKKMSELLFTHYNTVLYRINRIQEITNKALDNEMDRYGLQTALKIMKILDL